MLLRSLSGLGILVVLLAPSGAEAADDDEHGESHPHHFALFLGAGLETDREGEEEDKGLAVGLEYEYRLSERWGIGGVFETLGGTTTREVSVIMPVSLHPGGGWRLFAGPGYEFTEKKDKALLRLGAGYEFHLKGGWSLAPEFIVDLVDGGGTIWIAGVAIGYGF